MKLMPAKLNVWVLVACVACGGAVTTPIGGGDAGTPPPAASASTTPAPTSSSVPDAGPPPGSVGCGSTTCPARGRETPFCCVDDRPLQTTFVCRNDTDQCRVHQVACDDTSDCNGGDVCCAEVSYETARPTLFSTCRSSCITGVPRVQVCNAARQCTSGTCQAYECRGFPELKYCELPDFCR